MSMPLLQGAFYYPPGYFPADMPSISGHLAQIRGWGFNCISVPIYKQAFTPLNAWEVNWNYVYLLDEVVKQALNNGLYAILDWHQYRLSPAFSNVDKYASGFPAWMFEGYANSTSGWNEAWRDIIFRRTLKRGYDFWGFLANDWKWIAKRYQPKTHILAYGLLNEPHLPSGSDSGQFNSQLRSLHEFLIDGIRSVDYSKTLLFQPRDGVADTGLLAPKRGQPMKMAGHEYAPSQDWLFWIPGSDVASYVNLAKKLYQDLAFTEFGSLDPPNQTQILRVADSINSYKKSWIFWAYNCDNVPHSLVGNPSLTNEIRKRLSAGLSRPYAPSQPPVSHSVADIAVDLTSFRQ